MYPTIIKIIGPTLYEEGVVKLSGTRTPHPVKPETKLTWCGELYDQS